MKLVRKKALGGKYVFFIFLVMIGVMILAGYKVRPGWNWILTVSAIVVFLIAMGQNICGRPLGIFIDERNIISLSRFQLVMWMLVILSAFITMALSRIAAGVKDPLAIGLPWQLWALMGISTTSMIGSPMIRNTKKYKTPDKQELDKMRAAFAKYKFSLDQVKQGALFVKTGVHFAQFSDMFRGDEINNRMNIDIAKVQMFFFTIIAVMSYAVLLFHSIVTKKPENLSAFPELSEGLIAILSISHVGYLGNKVVDHTKMK